MKNRRSEIDANNYAERRAQMISDQIVARGISEPRLLSALLKVPRDEFVPRCYRDRAYDDRPLPIGYGQTISQPFAVASMIDALQIKQTDIVLEVGTGSGYVAAVLSHLAAQVHTVERLHSLARKAARRLKRLDYANVEVHLGDGTQGLPEFAPYDAIIVSAGGRELPRPYVDQLASGGRIVIPIGLTQCNQSLMRYTFHGDELHKEDLGKYSFVPLIGEYGW